MFGKKKEVAVTGQTATAPGAASPATSVTAAGVQHEKLPGPQELPMPVGRDLVVQQKQDPDLVWGLQCVMRPSAQGKNVFDVRVFNPNAASQSKVKIANYYSFDQHPELVLFQGTFDKANSETHLEAGKK